MRDKIETTLLFLFLGFIIGIGYTAARRIFSPDKNTEIRKRYATKVSTETFYEVSKRLDKIDSLYFEIDSLVK